MTEKQHAAPRRLRQTDGPPQVGRTYSGFGKWLVLLLLGVGVAATLYNSYFQWQRVARAKQAWGVDGALLIGHAPSVFAFRVEDQPTVPSPTGDVASPAITGDIALGQSINVSAWPGMKNLRQGLLDDRSFDWQVPQPQPTHLDWKYGLEFRQKNSRYVLLFDDERAWVKSTTTGKMVSLAPTYKEYHSFFKEVFR